MSIISLFGAMLSNGAASEYTTPVLDSVTVDGTDFILDWSISEGTPDGGYDMIIDGVDMQETWRTTNLTQTITGLSSGVTHDFQIEARWLQADPDEFPRSNTIYEQSGDLIVYPYAQGFGIDTIAGRGGAVIKVTNLNDTGAGSLRAAIDTSGARTIVFEVSGRIDLDSNLTISDPFCTIAGQTAPAPGIMLTGRTVVITSHDILIQHIAIRVGDEDKTAGPWDSTDSLQIIDGDAYNIVIDHVSTSWSIDENISTGYGVADITIINSIMSEPLDNSVHTKGSHGYNLLCSRDSNSVSFIGNLLAHGEARNPYFQGCSALFANNFVYNNGVTVREFMSLSTDSEFIYPWYVSIVGNLFKDGPDSGNNNAIKEWSALTHDDAETYMDDNSYTGTMYTGTKEVGSAPTGSWPTAFVADSVANVETNVLAMAGSRPNERDSVDTRIVAEVTAGTGGVIDSQTEVGGFPTYQENTRTFTTPANHDTDSGNGYTNLEILIHHYSANVEDGIPLP